MSSMSDLLVSSSGNSKMTIDAYKDIDYSQAVMGGSWEGDFNPSSIKQNAKIEYFEDMPIGSGGGGLRYKRTLPSEISFELLFDNVQKNAGNAFSILSGMMSLSGQPDPIMKQVSDFKKVCYSVNGDIHEPNYLIIQFGDYSFNGKVKNLDVDFSEFKSDGEALRANVKVSFVSAVSTSFVSSANNLNSPDMTHHRLVKQGETLASVCHQIYGTLSPIVALARLNGLTHLRGLEPGTRIVVPPLDQISTHA